MGIPYTMTATSLTIVSNFRPVVIPSSHINFAELRQLVQQPGTTEQDIEPLLNIPKAIETFTGGNVTVVNGRLFYKGFEVKNNLATVILDFVKAGKAEAAKPFERFMEKAFQNPDPRAVEGLYDWVVAGNLPITPDGDILAWKAVQADYFSIKAGPRGKLRHQKGDIVEEPRHETNGDPNQTCSRGIHFCSVEYLKSGGYASGGSRIMAVTISPTDVVAFPRDYNLSKGRCCRLTVVGEVPMSEVPGYYGAAGKVYSGWSPAPVAKVIEPKTRFPVQVGDVWRAGDGTLVTIVSVGSDPKGISATATGTGHLRRAMWWANDGTGTRSNGGNGGPGSTYAAERLVELVSEANPEAKPAAPRVASKNFDKPLAVGDRVELFDGRTVPIKSVCSNIAYFGDLEAVLASNGCGNYAGRPACPNDVKRIISRAKPKAPRTVGGIAKGQVWTKRNGQQVTIASINAGAPYLVKDDQGSVYTASGRFNDDRSTSQLDLVRLVKDVD